MKRILSVFFVVIAVLTSHVTSKAEEFTDKDAETVVKLSMNLLRERFIDPDLIDDVLSRDWRTKFAVSLDPQYLYFNQSDIEEFQDVKMDSGDPTFSLAKIVHERLKTKIVLATKRAEYRLTHEHDFTTDESAVRQHESFVVDDDALDERWWKRIKLILVMEKLNGETVPIASRQFIRRFGVIRDRVLARSTEEIFSRYLNSLLVSIDPHAGYFGPDFLVSFSWSHVRPKSLGLVSEQVDGEWQIVKAFERWSSQTTTHVSSILGKQIIAIRAGDAEIVMTGNSDRKAMRPVDGIRKDVKDVW